MPKDDELKYTQVQTIKGLYDERAESVTRDINQRSHCLKHTFVNASLYWRYGDHRSLSLEAEAKQGFRWAWGRGYGGNR